jgi:hypothetical protein
VIIHDWFVSFMWQEYRKDELLEKYFTSNIIIILIQDRTNSRLKINDMMSAIIWLRTKY